MAFIVGPFFLLSQLDADNDNDHLREGTEKKKRRKEETEKKKRGSCPHHAVAASVVPARSIGGSAHRYLVPPFCGVKRKKTPAGLRLLFQCFEPFRLETEDLPKQARGKQTENREREGRKTGRLEGRKA